MKRCSCSFAACSAGEDRNNAAVRCGAVRAEGYRWRSDAATQGRAMVRLLVGARMAGERRDGFTRRAIQKLGKEPSRLLNKTK